jgi:hypothetical protein
MTPHPRKSLSIECTGCGDKYIFVPKPGVKVYQCDIRRLKDEYLCPDCKMAEYKRFAEWLREGGKRV